MRERAATLGPLFVALSLAASPGFGVSSPVALVSRGTSGSAGGSLDPHQAISADGQRVAFVTASTNLGDGDTDIPTMKMLTYQGGHSIAVYDEQRGQKDLDKIHGLISDDRVDFVAPANRGG